MEKNEPVLESKSYKIIEIVPVIISLLGIIGIMLPYIGFAYEQGYLSVFGLNSELFPRELSELWTYSFYMTAIGIVTILKYYGVLCLAILGLIVSVACVILFIVKTIGKENLRAFFSMLESKKDEGSFVG